MVVAVGRAAESGARAVVCASTGNTAASAAAYAARAGLAAVVLTPAGATATAKRAQAVAAGAQTARGSRLLRRCACASAASWASGPAIVLVNSLNPDRIEGQKTVVFEIARAARSRHRRGRAAVRRRRERDAPSRPASPRQAPRRGSSSARRPSARPPGRSAIRIAEPAHAEHVAALVAAGRVEVVTLSEDEIRSALAAGSRPRRASSASRRRPPASPRSLQLGAGDRRDGGLHSHRPRPQGHRRRSRRRRRRPSSTRASTPCSRVRRADDPRDRACLDREPRTGASTRPRPHSTSGTRSSSRTRRRRSSSRSKAREPPSCRATRAISRCVRSRSSRRSRAIASASSTASRSNAASARAPRRSPSGSSRAARLRAASAATGELLEARPRARGPRGQPRGRAVRRRLHLLACERPRSRRADRGGPAAHVDPGRPGRPAQARRTREADCRSTVTHEDAAANAGFAALLGAAIVSGDAGLLGDALHDRLHEQYRAGGSPLFELLRSSRARTARSASRFPARAPRSWSGPRRTRRRASRPSSSFHSPTTPGCSRCEWPRKEPDSHEPLRQVAPCQAQQRGAHRRRRPRARARDAERRRLQRCRPGAAADRCRDHVDRDDAVQPQPPAARAAT